MITLSDLDKISECHIDQYIIFDLETSGVSTTGNRIISAEALLIKDGKVIGEFRRLANPGFMLCRR
jgi:DNA polymerase III alpha subunit (gram-positive type)